MSVAHTIFSRIKYLPKGEPFSIERFMNAGTRAAVDKAFSRLAAAGQLERVARGIYMRPKMSRFAGQVRPSAASVVRVIAQHNCETIQVHGAEAARTFNLSTQMQTTPVFYTSGATRELKIGQSTVRLLHVSPTRLQHAGTRVGMALAALFYLGKGGVTSAIVAAVKSKLEHPEFEKLSACKMPGWMRDAVQSVG